MNVPGQIKEARTRSSLCTCFLAEAVDPDYMKQKGSALFDALAKIEA